jgi:hypothetical protein
MTTAFAFAAEGRLIASAMTQPFGSLLALVASTMFWGGLHTGARGYRLGAVCLGMLRPRVVVAGVILFAAAWLYKVLTW